MGDGGALPGAVRPAHVRHHRGLSPLLLASLLQDQPLVPVRPGLPGAVHVAEERDLVGGAAPPSPQALRHRAGRALAASPRLLVLARGVDLRPALREDRPQPGPRPRPLPRAPLPAALRAAPLHRAGRGLLAGVWVGRTGGRLLLEHGAALPRHLLHQLAGARARQAALRHRRRLTQQLVARHHHAGRGVAQQSPRLPALGAAGLPLVGDRHHLLHPEGAGCGRAGVRHGEAARGCGGEHTGAGARHGGAHRAAAGGARRPRRHRGLSQGARPHARVDRGPHAALPHHGRTAGASPAPSPRAPSSRRGSRTSPRARSWRRAWRSSPPWTSCAMPRAR